MAKQTFTNTTTSGVWTTLATGECTIASLITTATLVTTLVTLRVKLANGRVSYILPSNTLQYNNPNRLAVGGLSLQAGDKLEAMSSDPVDWVTTAITGMSYKSSIVTSPDTKEWTTLVSGAATVRGVFVSTGGAGNVGIRLHKATVDASIVLSEKLDSGGSKRLMMPIVLATGDSLQVSGNTRAFWIATGVSA